MVVQCAFLDNIIVTKGSALAVICTTTTHSILLNPVYGHRAVGNRVTDARCLRTADGS
jgi:hypothetical protein